MSKATSPLLFFLLGILFALLWASAAAAAKFGLRVADPLVLYQFRFLIAGIVQLLIAHPIMRYRLPQKTEWRQLAWFGFLNVTVYLTLFVVAISEVAASIGSMALALNPLLMAILAAVFYQRGVTLKQIVVLVMGIGGVGLALYPLFGQSYATPRGVLIMGLSMVSYSVAAIYYSSKNWTLDTLTINGWQVLFGGLFMLPVTLIFGTKPTDYQSTIFWGSVLWNAIPVSGIAVYLWLWLLKQDTLRASYFLYISPIFGLIYAAWLLGEPITAYTLGGLLIVMAALGLGQLKKEKS